METESTLRKACRAVANRVAKRELRGDYGRPAPQRGRFGGYNLTDDENDAMAATVGGPGSRRRARPSPETMQRIQDKMDVAEREEERQRLAMVDIGLLSSLSMALVAIEGKAPPEPTQASD